MFQVVTALTLASLLGGCGHRVRVLSMRTGGKCVSETGPSGQRSEGVFLAPRGRKLGGEAPPQLCGPMSPLTLCSPPKPVRPPLLGLRDTFLDHTVSLTSTLRKYLLFLSGVFSGPITSLLPIFTPTFLCIVRSSSGSGSHLYPRDFNLWR